MDFVTGEGSTKVHLNSRFGTENPHIRLKILTCVMASKKTIEEQLCLEHDLLTEKFKISKVIHVDKICNYLRKTYNYKVRLTGVTPGGGGGGKTKMTNKN